MGLQTIVIVEASVLSVNEFRKAFVEQSSAICETLSLILKFPFWLVVIESYRKFTKCEELSLIL